MINTIQRGRGEKNKTKKGVTNRRTIKKVIKKSKGIQKL